MTTNLVVLSTSVGNPLSLHHTILKKAVRLGVYFVGTEDKQFRLAKADDPTLLSSETFSSTSEAFEALEAKEVTFVTPKQETGTDRGKCGVMNTSYHAKYSHNPHGPGSGDELDRGMRDAFNGKHDGKTQIDVEALRVTGEANNVWNPSWVSLNPGMRRMNLANRLRALLRNKQGDVRLLDRDGNLVVEGRFGIEWKGGK